MNRVVVQTNSVAHFQNQSHCELSNGSGSVGGDVGNRDLAGSAGLAVDNVLSSSLNADQFDIGAGI